MPLLQIEQFKSEGIKSCFAAPLIAKNEVIGVFQVFLADTFSPDPDWMDFLETLAGQAAIAISDFNLVRNLQQSNLELEMAYDATLEGWSNALDLRDKETEEHTERVTEITLQMARELGIEGEEIRNIWRGARLHDIGKMGVPDPILLKSREINTRRMGNNERSILRLPKIYLNPSLIYARLWTYPIATMKDGMAVVTLKG